MPPVRTEGDAQSSMDKKEGSTGQLTTSERVPAGAVPAQPGSSGILPGTSGPTFSPTGGSGIAGGGPQSITFNNINLTGGNSGTTPSNKQSTTSPHANQGVIGVGGVGSTSQVRVGDDELSRKGSVRSS